MLDLRREFKRVATPDHNVSVAARLKRADAIANAKQLSRRQRDCAQGIVVRHPIGDCISRFVLDIARVELRHVAAAGRDDHYAHAGFGQQRRVLLSLIQG